jgi:small subunit ribosomal protein S7
MPRRRAAEKRDILPDPKYNSKVVAKFINRVMYSGKRSLAQSIVYGALDIIGQKVKDKEPIEIFEKAIENVKPILEVKSRRVGGATYQVPIEVRAERKLTLAIKWIVGYSRGKKNKPMKERLATELLDAYNNQGEAIKKRDDTHRMAEANKAFAHFKW